MVQKFEFLSNFSKKLLKKNKKQKNATFSPPNIILLFIVNRLYVWSRNLNSGFTLKNLLFRGVKLAKNFDPDKYIYSGSSYGIRFDSCSEFSLSDGNVGKNVIIFGVDMRSSVHINNKEKDIFILDIGPKQGLNDTALTARAKDSTNLSRSNKIFC